MNNTYYYVTLSVTLFLQLVFNIRLEKSLGIIKYIVDINFTYKELNPKSHKWNIVKVKKRNGYNSLLSKNNDVNEYSYLVLYK